MSATAFSLHARGCRCGRRASTPQALTGRGGEESDLARGEDLYAIVGVPRSASDADIRTAYRQQAAIVHPDVSSDADAPRDFRRLSAAAAILLSPRRDSWHSEGNAEWPTDMDMDRAYARPDRGDDNGLMANAKQYGPVWSAVIGPWLSWYIFVALDKLIG